MVMPSSFWERIRAAIMPIGTLAIVSFLAIDGVGGDPAPMIGYYCIDTGAHCETFGECLDYEDTYCSNTMNDGICMGPTSGSNICWWTIPAESCGSQMKCGTRMPNQPDPNIPPAPCFSGSLSPCFTQW